MSARGGSAAAAVRDETFTVAIDTVDAPDRRPALRDSAARLGLIAAALALLALIPAIRLPGGLLLVAAVAYANGSNDVSKAIATLVGSGVSNYSRAIAWGTMATAVGAGLSAYTGAGLVATFSKGLLSKGTPSTLALALGVIAGTVGWVSVSTRLSLPVSTTHAALGSIVGAGAVAFGTGHVEWGALGQKVVLPLLLSPLVGLVIAVILILALRPLRGPRRGLAPLHWLSSAGTAVARGLNDAPKLAGLAALLFLAVRSAPSDGEKAWIVVMIAAAMGLGSFIGGRRVTATLAERVTRMDDREGLAANLATSTLVTAAAVRGLPVSTTHVSGGSIAGIGAEARDGRLNLRVVRDVALAWVITIPGAAIIAVAAWGLVTLLQR